MGARSSRNTTQNNRSDGHLLEYFRNTFVRGGGAAPLSFFATGGAITTPGNGYRYHTFTSSGTFSIQGGPISVEFLAVAGGGGGAILGGGAGSGGLVYVPSTPIESREEFAIVIGGGGSGGEVGPPGVTGSPTTLILKTTSTTIIANGGGGSRFQGIGNTGGSGGGACGPNVVGPGNQPTANPGISGLLQYGNPGGLGVGGSPFDLGGGGGGAGGAGNGGPTRSGGVGLQYPQFTGPLIGVPTLAPLSGYFAGGGGGGSRTNNGPLTQPATGGSGGGGSCGGTKDGTTNSGGGGAGGVFNDNPGGPGSIPGGNGGSGIVVIRYPS